MHEPASPSRFDPPHEALGETQFVCRCRPDATPMPRKHLHDYETRYHAVAKYSKVIRGGGGFVFMQGQVGMLLDGTLVDEGDSGDAAAPGLQEHQMLNERGWGSLRDFCKLTV